MNSTGQYIKRAIEEAVVLPNHSSEDELLASSQETIAVEDSRINVIRSNTVMKPTTGTFGSEAADGLVALSLESTVVKLCVTSTSRSTPQKQGLANMSLASSCRRFKWIRTSASNRCAFRTPSFIWVAMKEVGPQVNSRPFQFCINGECLETLEKM